MPILCRPCTKLDDVAPFVIVAGFKAATSEELVDACDRVYYLDEVIHGFTLNMES